MMPSRYFPHRGRPGRPSARTFGPFLAAGLARAGCFALVIWGGCGPFAAPNGDFIGATPGGTQDMAFARQVIEDGGVPSPESVTVEGLLSEHSIPIEPPPDAGLLYATAAAAWNHDFDALTPLATVQIGFGTTLDRDAFQRRPLNLCLVIDRSGSMAYELDDRTRTPKLDAVRIAIDRLLAQLTAEDRVSIVSFAEGTRKELDPVAGDDVQAVKEALDGLKAEGATNLALGMERGYNVVAAHRDAARADRLFVFTDAHVTSGTRNAADFIDIMEEFADDEIGATIFGVGTDFDEELAYDISQVRGNNLFYLNNYDRIVTVFDDDFDFMVTPIAYDVALTAEIPFAWDVEGAYGLPEVETNTHLLEMKVPTLFLSARSGGGAILIRLRAGSMVNFEEEMEIARVHLAYDAEGEAPKEMDILVTLPGGLSPDAAEPWFASDAVKRGVLLLNTALTIDNACEDLRGRRYNDYWGDYYGSPDDADYQRAVARLSEFLVYFDALAEGLEDRPEPESRALSQERAVVAKLLENISGPPVP